MFLKHKESIVIVLCVAFNFTNGSFSGTLQKIYDDAISNLKKFVGISTTEQPVSFIDYAKLNNYKYQNPGSNYKYTYGLMRKPSTEVSSSLDEDDDDLACPPDPCSNPCTNPSPCCKRQCPSTKKPEPELPVSSLSEEVTPKSRPTPSEKAPCSLKLYCNGQWKYMKGTPGIGNCWSLKCQQIQCDTADLSLCNFILRGEMQTIECVGDGCTAACEGELCKSMCQGSCCHAKCYGRGCTASCKGNECTTKENSHVLRNGKPFTGPMLARHHQFCRSYSVARSTGPKENTKKDRNLVYFDMKFDADDVTSLFGG